MIEIRRIPRPHLVAASVVFVALAAIGFLPLFGGPGYEQSLASGLVVPSAAAIATALVVSRSEAGPLAGVALGLATGASFAGVAFLTALLHGLRVGLCDLSGGAVLFALTAGVGALMGGTWGASVGEWARGRESRRLRCVLGGLGGPLAGIVMSVMRFWASPMIFAYDPFFGFFSGTLYDTVIDVRTELWTYRAGSLSTLVGVALVASVFRRVDTEPPVLRLARADASVVARLSLGVVALLASAAVAVDGSALGHWQTSRSIARALGGRVSGPRCDVVYPDSLVAAEAELLLRDCEQELAADERKLGAHLDGRLTEFVFRDVDQKRALTGAAHTSIAKPWRREVYIQLASYPHPVLGHEIAHVVAGTFGQGPFRIAGSVRGLWPNPGLIEGTAVATSPDDDELTGSQWARAMLDLGLLPPIEGLFSVGFLGENAAKSYTIAGAFVTWVMDRWGPRVVRSWYAGASIELLTGQRWPALDAQFRDALRTLSMPPGASAYAHAKFERPSVWRRKCPHVVDALNRLGDKCQEDHQFAQADRLYEQALARDPQDWQARFQRARLDAWYGDHDRGRRGLEALASVVDAPLTWRDRAVETLADDDLARGSTARAVAEYRLLRMHILDEDASRTLEVKAESGEEPSGPEARRAIVDLLIGEPGLAGEPWVSGLSLGAWAEQSNEPIASYLAGKNLAQHARYARAASWLDRALDSGAMAPVVERELLRQRAICACALRDAPSLDDVKRRALAAGSPFEDSHGGGRKQWLLDFVARCRP